MLLGHLQAVTTTAVGLVVRTIAGVWDIGLIDIIHRMEPLHLHGDHDLRPDLPTADGDSVRVTAIRMRNYKLE
jgi:hypothetical protein